MQRRTLLATILATMMIVLMPGVADASSHARREPSPPERQAPPESPYAPQSTGDVTTMATSPSGCVQRANNPHYSTHVAGRMNAEVRATCATTVPRMYHTSQLWETRWWGWDRIGVKGVFDRTWASRGSAYGNDTCRNNLIRATGDGFVDDRDGQRYYSATESNWIDNPCNL